MPMTPGCQPCPATTATFAADHNDGGAPDAQVVFDHRDGFIEYGLFDLAALLVQHVEFARDVRRFGRVVGREQPRAEIAAPYPAARVDARTEHEAKVIGLKCVFQACHIHQRGDAGDGLARAD